MLLRGKTSATMETIFKLAIALYALQIVFSEPFDRVRTLPIWDQVEHYGYKYENHTITTGDGYILLLSRIALSPKCTKNKGAIILQHGLANSAVVYVYGGSKDLAFLLSDECFDVWMPNARGTKYSNSHVRLKYDEPNYWNYTIHELATFDTLSSIDYVINTTKESQIQYIGFSIGTSQLLLLLSIEPSYMRYIQSAHFIAPAIYLGNFQVILPPMLPNLLLMMSKVLNSRLHVGAFKNKHDPMEMSKRYYDASKGELDMNGLIELYYDSHFPEQQSAKVYSHLVQWAALARNRKDHGVFQAYDHGTQGNLRIYGQFKPFKYNFERVNIPIYLYHGSQDPYVSAIDVEMLSKDLANVVTKHIYDVSHDSFTKNKTTETTRLFVCLVEEVNNAKTNKREKQCQASPSNKITLNYLPIK